VIGSISFAAHAAIRPQRVDAASVTAQVRYGVALVDIVAVDGIADFQAKFFVGFAAFGWAMLAHETPGGAHCAAAIGLGYLHETIGTRSAPSVHQLTETVTSSAIDTLLAIGTGLESFVTFALEGSFSVDAVAVLAEVVVGRAFVHVAAVIGHSDLLESFRTDAHERTNQVLASEFTVVGRRGTFVHILTVTSISSQCVTVGADAAEGSGYVVAAEGALVAHFLTLVDVFADLHRSRSETVSTLALESTFDVGACSVAADVVNGTLVVVDTFMTGFVEDESHRTLAAEGSVRVDAFTTVANARHDVTFVEIFAFGSTSRTARTQFPKFGRIFRWTFITGTAPSASHGTAALSLGHSRHSRVEAHSSTEAVEAELFSDVDALFSVGAQDVAGGAFADEAAVLVDAVAVLAETHIHLTFVNV